MGRLALLDSNILIDALNGVSQALTEISYYDDTAISAVAWIEVMSKPLAASVWSNIFPIHVQMARDFLKDFTVIHTDDAIMAETARIRSSSLVNPPKIRLPDAIILATANLTGRLLITRNKKDFCGSNIRFPYELLNTTAFNVAKPPTK